MLKRYRCSVCGKLLAGRRSPEGDHHLPRMHRIDGVVCPGVEAVAEPVEIDREDFRRQRAIGYNRARGVVPAEEMLRAKREAQMARALELRAAYESGLSTTALAKQCGVSHQRISQLLAIAGTTFRPAYRPRVLKRTCKHCRKVFMPGRRVQGCYYSHIFCSRSCSIDHAEARKQKGDRSC